MASYWPNSITWNKKNPLFFPHSQVTSTKVSFLWDQSEDMSFKRVFLLKRIGLWMADLSGLPIRALFFKAGISREIPALKKRALIGRPDRSAIQRPILFSRKTLLKLMSSLWSHKKLTLVLVTCEWGKKRGFFLFQVIELGQYDANHHFIRKSTFLNC